MTATTPQQAPGPILSELLPCPFCGCAISFASNNDWHRIEGDHDGGCPIAWSGSEFALSASDSNKAWATGEWNRRAAPVGEVAAATDLAKLADIVQDAYVDYSGEHLAAGHANFIARAVFAALPPQAPESATTTGEAQ